MDLTPPKHCTKKTMQSCAKDLREEEAAKSNLTSQSFGVDVFFAHFKLKRNFITVVYCPFRTHIYTKKKHRKSERVSGTSLLVPNLAHRVRLGV